MVEGHETDSPVARTTPLTELIPSKGPHRMLSTVISPVAQPVCTRLNAYAYYPHCKGSLKTGGLVGPCCHHHHCQANHAYPFILGLGFTEFRTLETQAEGLTCFGVHVE